MSKALNLIRKIFMQAKSLMTSSTNLSWGKCILSVTTEKMTDLHLDHIIENQTTIETKVPES